MITTTHRHPAGAVGSAELSPTVHQVDAAIRSDNIGSKPTHRHGAGAASLPLSAVLDLNDPLIRRLPFASIALAIGRYKNRAGRHGAAEQIDRRPARVDRIGSALALGLFERMTGDAQRRYRRENRRKSRTGSHAGA